MEFPLHYFEGNLMFTPDKKCWALYEIPGVQYDFKSVSTKKSIWQRLLGFFWSIDKSARLLFLPEEYTFQEHFDNLKANASGPFVEFAHKHADLSREWLEKTYEELGGMKYRVFVSLKVADDTGFWDTVRSAKDYIVKLIKEPKAQTDRFLGLSGLELQADELKVFKEMEDRLFNRMKKFIVLERPVESDIEWIVRRNFWKGIGKPPQRFIWSNKGNQRKNQAEEPARVAGVKNPVEGAVRIGVERSGSDKVKVKGKKVIRPRLAEYMPMTEGLVDTKSNPRMVKVTQLVDGKEVTSYSAYLTMTDKPDDFYIPGNEYIYQLYDLDFPVGVSMYIEPMEYQEARAKLKGKKMDIDDQAAHTSESQQDLPLNLLEAHKEAIGLEKDIDDNKFPMMDTSFVFEVHASDEKTLLERVDALIDFYKSMHIELVNPAGEQWQLFNEFLPLGGRLCSADYVHRLSPHALAASMITATKRLGDGEGFFIGTTGIMNIPVFFNPALGPQKRNRSGSGAIIGSLGGGKSFTANFLAWLLAIYGGKGLIFDPKGDRKLWKEHLIEFGEELEIIKLTDDEQFDGVLDPWGMFDDVNEAASVSMNIITFLANLKPDDDEFIYLTESIEKVKLLNKKRRSNMAIITELESMKDEGAKRLGRKLRSISKMSQARLIFCEGTPKSISTDRRLTVLQVDGLNLPEAGTPRGDYDITQTLAVALMMSISAFATKFAEEDPDEFTVVILDEFWALSGTKEGKRLATRLIRTGRSFFAAIIIISQNADDLLDEKIKNNLGFKFVFRSTDEDEIRNVLKFLNLEPTAENIELIRSLENGRPLFQDLDGHCGIVDIEPIFGHLIEAFKTTPGQQKKVS